MSSFRHTQKQVSCACKRAKWVRNWQSDRVRVVALTSHLHGNNFENTLTNYNKKHKPKLNMRFKAILLYLWFMWKVVRVQKLWQFQGTHGAQTQWTVDFVLTVGSTGKSMAVWCYPLQRAKIFSSIVVMERYLFLI